MFNSADPFTNTLSYRICNNPATVVVPSNNNSNITKPGQDDFTPKPEILMEQSS